MLVEHAERFGLSQLHQLRGRVGRGPHQSYCVLLYQAPLTEQSRRGSKALTETTDGFEIAERDLQMRGPGDFFGTRQSGLPTLRVGDLLRDHQLMEDGAPRGGGRTRRSGPGRGPRGVRAGELGAAVRVGRGLGETGHRLNWRSGRQLVGLGALGSVSHRTLQFTGLS